MTEPTCTNPYGPESGPHDGPAEYAAVLVGSRGTELTRVAPLCHAHAQYEQRWRASLGAIAKVRVERVTG